MAHHTGQEYIGRLQTLISLKAAELAPITHVKSNSNKVSGAISLHKPGD